MEWSGNLIQIQSESIDVGWSLRAPFNQFPRDANTGPASTLVANFLALRIQQQRIQRPLPLGRVSSWARSVLDPNKGGEVEVRGHLRVLESQLEENVEDV